jgi:hypothetical protein
VVLALGNSFSRKASTLSLMELIVHSFKAKALRIAVEASLRAFKIIFFHIGQQVSCGY